jgi:hypothetical protein
VGGVVVEKKFQPHCCDTRWLGGGVSCDMKGISGVGRIKWGVMAENISDGVLLWYHVVGWRSILRYERYFWSRQNKVGSYG